MKQLYQVFPDHTHTEPQFWDFYKCSDKWNVQSDMMEGRGEVFFGSQVAMHKAKEELNGYDINGKRIEIIIKVC